MLTIRLETFPEPLRPQLIFFFFVFNGRQAVIGAVA